MHASRPPPSRAGVSPSPRLARERHRGTALREVLAGIGVGEALAMKRFTMSNGHVDAAGTTDPLLAEAPPACALALAAAVQRGAVELQSAANERSHEGYLGADEALKLSKAAFKGEVTLESLLAATKACTAKGVTLNKGDSLAVRTEPLEQ